MKRTSFAVVAALVCPFVCGNVSVARAQAASTATYWVYDNGVFNWPGDYSFNASPNYADTAGGPLSGSKDVAVSLTGQWGGWLPYAPNWSFNVTPYKYLTFALKPTAANQKWNCYFVAVGDVGLASSNTANVLNYGPAPVVGQWATYTIPLTLLGVQNATVYKFAIQDQTGLASNTWYVDNVGFAASSAAASGKTPKKPVGFCLGVNCAGTSASPPTVAITAPANGASVSGTVAVGGTAADAAGVSSVALSVDGGAFASASGTTAWSFSLNAATLAAGVHTVTARATSVSGKTATASISVTALATGTSGYDGVIAVNSAGLLVNGAGKPIELRGSNMPMDSQVMSPYWTGLPFGIYAGAGGPPWPTYATWRPNVFRITLNTGAWLNLNSGVFSATSTAVAPTWSGTQVPGDPGLNYKSSIMSMITAARAIGSYVIIDVHWSAPSFTFNGVTNWMGSYGQPLFLSDDMDYPLWAAAVGAGPMDATGHPSSGLVAWLMANAKNPKTGNINDIIFELFNEPYLDGQTLTLNTASGGTGTALTREQLMLNGGWVSAYCNQSVGTGRGGMGLPQNLQVNYCFQYWWKALGYQKALNGIRSLGATNVVLVNGLSWSSKQSTINQVYPTDTLNPPQVGTGWHIYESTPNGGYPGTTDAGNGTSSAYQYAAKTIAGTGGIGHPIPVVITEYGNAPGYGSGPSAPQPDPYMVNVHNWVDAQTLGSVGAVSWSWPLPATYGNTTTQSYQETVLGAPFNFTTSFSGSTMTVTSGSGIQPGLVLTSGASDRTVVSKQLTGTAGGAGTYAVSIAQTAASATVQGQYWLPNKGQGQTEFNWMTTHP